MTAIAVVESRLPTLDVFRKLEKTLADVAVDHEIVIIANDPSAETTQQLQTIVNAVANVTIHFLAQRIDRDTAVLVGLDHALGDWVVILTPTEEEVASLPRILERAGPYEVVFAGARDQKDIPAAYRYSAQVYFKLYEMVSGTVIDWPAPRIRIYSRAAARYLADLLDGEFALRSLKFSGSFPGIRETVDSLPASDFQLPSRWLALRKAFRGILNANAVPLRAVIGTAIFSGLVAVLSSIYAIVIYLVKENVTPGWTTLSLQISTMMVLFSVMFALLAEYVLKIYRTIAPRRRIAIVRELRSPLRRQPDRLNVIGTSGTFHLGALPDQSSSSLLSEDNQ